MKQDRYKIVDTIKIHTSIQPSKENILQKKPKKNMDKQNKTPQGGQ